MISIKDLWISYQNDKPVIKGLNLDLGNAQIHGLVGLNGSGKTTLLTSIYGQIKPDKGSIEYPMALAPKKQIAFLETENFFYSNITAREFLRLFKNESFDLEQWNAIFELPLDQLIDYYSTGMKKKLALLSVLKLDKDILILDEPFNGLDIETSKALQLIIKKLKERAKTIIVTSHILESLTGICDQIHFLKDGAIKFSKSKPEFITLDQEIFESFDKANLIDDL